MNKRALVIGSVLVLLLLVGVSLFGMRSNNKTAQDTGGDPYITIKDERNDLYNFMVYDDYKAVTNRLTDFVLSEGDSAKGTVVVVSDVKPPYRGNGTETTFIFSIPSLGITNKTAVVNITGDDTATFIVKDTGFKVGLYSGEQLP